MQLILSFTIQAIIVKEANKVVESIHKVLASPSKLEHTIEIRKDISLNYQTLAWQLFLVAINNSWTRAINNRHYL